MAAGSFGYKELILLSNNAFENHSIALGGSYLTSDNNYTYLVPQSFNNPSESIEEPLKNNDFEKLSLFINNNANYGQHQLRLNLQYNQQDKALANYQNNSPENTSTLNSEQIRYGLQHYWLADITYFDSIEFEGLELDYSGESKDELYLDSPNDSRRNTSDYQSEKQHIGIKSNLNWQTLSLIPFIDINLQRFNSYSETNGQPKECNGISSCDIKANQTKLNLGARLEWQSQN